MKFTKEAWISFTVFFGGGAVLTWFTWAMGNGSLFGTSSKLPNWWIMTLFVMSLWALLCWGLTVTTLRDREHRWLITKNQAARAKAEDAERNAWLEENIRLIVKAKVLAAKEELGKGKGDATIIAYFLGVPVDEVAAILEEK